MALGFLGKALGAVAGGLGTAFGLGTKRGRKTLFGEKGKFQQYPSLSPEQIGYQNQLLQGLGQASPLALDRLSQLLSGDPEAFSAFEAPALRQFERQIVPGIMERFAGAGTHGALSSGGLNQALAAAAKDLGVDLQALRANLQQEAIRSLPAFSQLGLGSRFQTAYRPPTGGLIGGLAPGIGQALGSYGTSQGLQALGYLGNQGQPQQNFSFPRTNFPTPGISYGY